MKRLTGKRNPILKEVRSLKDKSGRLEKGLYFIEGFRFVSEALKETADIKYVIVSETFLSGKEYRDISDVIQSASIDLYVVPDSLFDLISDTKNPQGILAVLALNKLMLKDAVLTGGMMVVLDDIRDPGNMGTIIRTADAAGCSGVIVPDGCVDVFNPKVLRSTMGSVFHVPIYHCGTISEALSIAKDHGFLLCASHLEGSASIYETDLSGNVALIIGSESTGISDAAFKNADLLVRIPMEGRAESLNASVAAGIMMFEAMRQRNQKKEKAF